MLSNTIRNRQDKGVENMSKQYRKLQNKIYNKPHKDKRARAKEKIGRDYLLIGVLIFTFIVTIAGWTHVDNMNRAMYVLLTGSLGLTDARRHAKIKEDYRSYLDRASVASMGLAVAMFLIVLYYQYIA